jgi:F-type H+-transporting ATPase subunit c
MLYWGLLGLGLAVGLPIGVIGAGIGQGRAVAAGLEGMARQPEAAGTIQTAMIIGLAIIESLVIYALLMFFMLKPLLPSVAQATDAIKATAATTTVTR